MVLSLFKDFTCDSNVYMINLLRSMGPKSAIDIDNF